MSEKRLKTRTILKIRKDLPADTKELNVWTESLADRIDPIQGSFLPRHIEDALHDLARKMAERMDRGIRKELMCPTQSTEPERNS